MRKCLVLLHDSLTDSHVPRTFFPCQSGHASSDDFHFIPDHQNLRRFDVDMLNLQLPKILETIACLKINKNNDLVNKIEHEIHDICPSVTFYFMNKNSQIQDEAEHSYEPVVGLKGICMTRQQVQKRFDVSREEIIRQ